MSGASENMDTVYLKERKFQWGSIDPRALGMILTNIKTDIMKLNLEKMVRQFETCLKQWEHRKLTLMGNVVKLLLKKMKKR